MSNLYIHVHGAKLHLIFKTNVSYILSKYVYCSIFAQFSMLKANSDMYSIAFLIEKIRKFFRGVKLK